MRPAIAPISARQTKPATQFSDSFGDSRTAPTPVNSEVAFQRASDAFPVDTLFDLAPCGYVITTPDGLLVRANQPFCRITGYDEHELIDRRRFVDLLSVGGQLYHETHFLPMLQMHGTAREIALDLVGRDGSRLPVLVNSVLHRADDGTPIAVHTAVFEASHRRQYERELLAAKQQAEASEAKLRSLARTLQESLMPPALPVIPDLRVAAVYHPAGEGHDVGGDLYDVFEVAANDWCVLIGDVCGKGVDAGIVSALARHTLRAVAMSSALPSYALHTLNEILLRHESTRFCTVAVLRLRREDGMWRIVTSIGGHPPPVVVGPDDVSPLGVPGPLVGILASPTFVDTERVLRPGETVVLYTDGVTEARAPDGVFYGEDRFHRTVIEHGGPASALPRHLVDDVLRFQAGPARDDIAVLAVTAALPD